MAESHLQHVTCVKLRIFLPLWVDIGHHYNVQMRAIKRQFMHAKGLLIVTGKLTANHTSALASIISFLEPRLIY
jgi:hypothetical protein